ncbi:MAG TPA: L-threonylcarbamoyladenylate synthase [Candidatus Limnocylindrales bacterium]|jgi:tRNA threonylcarbamoyl adenosine modification protein (Sua5/YciO/YrdC/YwlC family)
MEVVRSDEPGALERAAGALGRGEVIAIPTETVYGLAALPRAGSVEHLIAAKQRSTEKGIQLLVDSLEQVRAVCMVPPAAQKLADAFWPGGLTIVLDRRADSDLPLLLGGGRATLGVRLPDHPLPRELARMLGPLAASSANVTGRPPATTAHMVIESLSDVVSLIVDDGPVRGGVSSTVVDCSGSAAQAPVVLREGAIAGSEIFAALGQEYTSR